MIALIHNETSRVRVVHACQAYTINQLKNIKREVLWIFIGMRMRDWHYLGRKVNVLGQFALWKGSFNTNDLQLGATWRSVSQSVCFNLLESTPQYLQAACWDSIKVGLGALVDNSKNTLPVGNRTPTSILLSIIMTSAILHTLS